MAIGWIVLVISLLVFIVSKIVYNILCCRLCLNLEVGQNSHDRLEKSGEEEEMVTREKYRTLEDVQ